MSKLHEILAVERDLESASKKMVLESNRTLQKENLFLGFVKTYEPFAEENAHLASTEITKLETTVDENIDYMAKVIGKHWDCVLSKDATNQLAKADLIVEGDTIAKGLPATFLLGLETKLNQVRLVYSEIPTLAPGIHWAPDASNAKAGVFKTIHAVGTTKTENTLEWKEISPATERHPAQLKEIKTINVVGKYSLTKECGMLTPVDKAERLERLDTLISAVKQARARANCEVVQRLKITDILFGYINYG